MHSNLNFALQFRCFIRDFWYSNSNLTMKKANPFLALILKIQTLSIDMKSERIKVLVFRSEISLVDIFWMSFRLYLKPKSWEISCWRFWTFYGKIGFFIGFGPRHVHLQRSRTLEKYFIDYWGPLESFWTETLRKKE